MKNTTVDAAQRRPSTPVTLCENLLLDADGSLRPAPLPEKRPWINGRMLARGYSTDFVGSCALRVEAFSAADGGYPVWVTNENDQLGYWLSPSEPLCGVWTGDRFLLMTADGPVSVWPRLGAWEFVAVEKDLPQAVISTVDAGVISSTTPSFQFTDVDFTRSAPSLSDSGLRQLSAALSESYSEIASMAASAGSWIAPVVARWHIVGHSGRRLYSSEPQIVRPYGYPCAGDYTAEGVRTGTDFSVSAFSLSANAFRLRVDTSAILASPYWSENAVAVELTCSPQLHTFDPAQSAAYRIVRPSLPNPSLTVAVPGATDRFSSLSGARDAMLQAMAERMESAEERVALIQLSDSPVTVALPRVADAADELKDFKRRSSLPLATTISDSSLWGRLLTAGSFVARCVSVNGNTLIWGDISLPAFPDERYYGSVVTTSLDAPLTPLGSLTVCDSQLFSLQPAVRSRSSWDSSRGNFYALAEGGIFAVRCSSAQVPASAVLIDYCGIDSPSNVVYTPSAVYVLSRGKLISVSSGASKAVADSVEASAVGWQSSTDEIWLLGPDGRLEIYNTAGGSWRSVAVNGLKFTSISQQQELMELYVGDSPYVVSDGPPQSCDVAWSVTVEVADLKRIKGLQLRAASSSIVGSLTVDGSEGFNRHNLLTVSLDGQLRHPLTLRTLAPFRRYLTATLRASVSPDFRLRSLSLLCSSVQ